MSEADVPAAPAGEDAGAAYSRRLIARNGRHEVAAARWIPGRSCVLHGHSDSAVAFRVLSGTIVEERYIPDGKGGYRYETGTLRAGCGSYLPRGSYHRICCLEEAATVHAFSPVPSNATAPVPDDVQRKLARARRQVKRATRTPLFLSVGPGNQPPAVKRRSIEEIIRERAEAWGRSEEEQTTAGHTRMAAATLSEIRSSGVLAAPIPDVLGGWGCSLRETAEAIRILARQAPATALALAMPLGNSATARIPDAVVPESHRAELAAGRRWVAEQVNAGRILAVANSEPGAGGDLSQTRTQAVRAGDGTYRLTGRKSFATLGPDADYFLCAARHVAETGAGADLAAGCTVDGFFVAREAAGVALDDQWDPLGMRTTASVGLTLADAPAAAVLGYTGCLQGVNARHWSTVLFAAVFVGLGEGAIATAVKAVGSAGAQSCYVRASLAECMLGLEAAAGFLEAVASDERWPLPAAARTRTLRAKTFAAKAAVDTTTRAAVVCGGRAYRADHPVSVFLHDSLAGPLLRPPLPSVMDGLAEELFSA